MAKILIDEDRTPVCYGYGRHSTAKQELSREVQEHRCFDYWTRNLAPKGVDWGGWYYDKAQSGKKPFTEREYGRQVYALAQPGDHVICSKLDRAFRSLKDGIDTMEMFAARGVVFHSMDLQIDTSTPLGKFFKQILLAVAELEREFIRERTREAIELRKSQGRPYSHGCPVGWKKKGERPNQYYRIDPAERQLVSCMSSLRQCGASYDEIALWTFHQKEIETKRHFPTRTQVKWAILAEQAGYPKIPNYKLFIRGVKLGEIVLGST
jgi:DNA invertase Pin-like site-specific DNA recombinase